MNLLITEKHSENARSILVDSDIFETMKVTDTYDHAGQLVSHYDAGSSIEIISQEVADWLSGEMSQLYDNYETVWKEGDTVLCFDDQEEFELLLQSGDDDGFQLYVEEVEAYNYWDGHNWKSIIIESEFNDNWITHESTDDIDDILKAFENKKFVQEKFGAKYYKSKNFVFRESPYQGSVGIEILNDWEAETILA